MKDQVLFSLKNNETVLMNAICCSCDRHFKGYELTSNENSGKTENDRVASLEVYASILQT